MYTFFRAKGFRGFRDLEIRNPKRVNLIAGMNNVGKTALLEALFLHCGAHNPDLTMNVNAFRGIGAWKLEFGRWTETPWDSLFTDFDTSGRAVLEGDDDVAGRRSVVLRVVREREELLQSGTPFLRSDAGRGESALLTTEPAQVLELGYEYEATKRSGRHYLVIGPNGAQITPIPPPPPFPAFFQPARTRIPPSDEAERFGNLEVRGKHDVVSRVLRLIEPRLRRLSVVVSAGQPMLHGDSGTGRLIPLPLMGDGMVRLSDLVLQIGNAPHGVVLVDEIENGLHHSVMATVWRAIGEVAREFDTQVFATTHSWECIVAAHRAFSESGSYDFCLYRLERIDEDVHAVGYDQEALDGAIEAGLEVR